MMTTDIFMEIPSEEFTSVNITCSVSDLTVYRSEDDMAHIECKNVPDGSSADVQSGILRVRIKEHDFLDMIFRDPFNSPMCRIGLPQKVYDAFSADIGVGNGRISDIDCVNARIKTGTGNVRMDNVRVTKMTLLESGVGNITMDKLESSVLELKSGTGDIAVRGTLCCLDIQGGIGNIRFEGKANGDISVKGGIGNIDIKLHGKQDSDRKLRTDHGLGKINIEYV